MNAAETIEAAIKKLSQLRREACGPGPWTATEEGVMESGSPVVENGIGGPAWWSDGDRDLVVTLHATINAQLAILQDSIDYRDTLARAGVEWVEKGNSAVFLLARSILGEQADA